MPLNIVESLGLHSLWVFAALMARFGPVLWLAPPFNSRAIPARVRILLTVAMAFVLTPAELPTSSALPENTLQLSLALGSELFLGGVLAGIFALTISSLKIVGHIAGSMTGLTAMASAGPDEEFSTSLTSLFSWIALAVLLTTGMHRLLLECCLESLQTQPLGTVRFQDYWFAELEYILRHTFSVGIRAGTCIAAVLLISNLCLGLLARATPQLNIFSVGFSTNVLSLLAVLLLTIGGVGMVYEAELSEWIRSCQRIIRLDS